MSDQTKITIEVQSAFSSCYSKIAITTDRKKQHCQSCYWWVEGAGQELTVTVDIEFKAYVNCYKELFLGYYIACQWRRVTGSYRHV